MNSLEEAYSLVRETIKAANTTKAINHVCIAVCKWKNRDEIYKGALHTRTELRFLYARVEMVYRSNGAKENASVRITIPAIGYEDKFCYRLTEKTIRAKTAKAIAAWNEAAERTRLLAGPFVYRDRFYAAEKYRPYAILNHYCASFESGMDYHEGSAWGDHTFPLLVRVYKETGALTYGSSDEAIKEAANA